MVETVERLEFARGHIEPGERPVEPRPAATLVLARAGAGGMETLLLRRPPKARFAAGAYVFPGGTIDEADGAPELADALPPEPREERAALVAALRELFEETGLLLSDAPPEPEEARRAREELLTGRVPFAAVVARLGLAFRTLETVYFGRWITPARLARRYDTRFFLTSHRGGEPELTAEHTAYRWMTPGEAVTRFRERRLPMLFPTWKTLERLSVYRGLEDALRDLRGRRVEPILARIIVEGDRIRPVMPGDPGYEEAM